MSIIIKNKDYNKEDYNKDKLLKYKKLIKELRRLNKRIYFCNYTLENIHFINREKNKIKPPSIQNFSNFLKEKLKKNLVAKSTNFDKFPPILAFFNMNFDGLLSTNFYPVEKMKKKKYLILDYYCDEFLITCYLNYNPKKFLNTRDYNITKYNFINRNITNKDLIDILRNLRKDLIYILDCVKDNEILCKK